jgi:imidazole glycerol-phosphate synthase subunit HisH
MITVVDYGVGNLGSIINMFRKIGVEAHISADIAEIEKAEKILLPGVGAFDAAMGSINDKGFIPVLNHCALERKIPVMGICLGMQLLTQGSEEGNMKGLGWLDAYTHKFRQSETNPVKIPHMGWNTVTPVGTSPLTTGFDDTYKFYFSHSYYVQCRDKANVILKTTHGVTFDAAIQKGNIFGTQFHPEKSHKYGMDIFRNFSNL